MHAQTYKDRFLKPTERTSFGSTKLLGEMNPPRRALRPRIDAGVACSSPPDTLADESVSSPLSLLLVVESSSLLLSLSESSCG